MLTIIFISTVLVFVAAFVFYGRFLDRRFDVNNQRATPSHTDYDGIDRVPAHPAVLFGLIAHLYGLTEEEFAYMLTTFPLVPDPVKIAAHKAYREIERGLIK